MVHLFGTFGEFYAGCAMLGGLYFWIKSLPILAYQKCTFTAKVFGIVLMGFLWPVFITVDVIDQVRK